MTTPFSDDEVIRRTARRLGTNDTRVRDWLAAYTDEWLRHAQETGHGQYAIVERPEPTASTEKMGAKAPAKAAKKATSARKAPAKVRTPAKGKATAQGDSAGSGNAMVDAAIRREAEASVKLDGETHVVGEPMNSSDTTTPDVPDGTPPPPSEAPRVTAADTTSADVAEVAGSPS